MSAFIEYVSMLATDLTAGILRLFGLPLRTSGRRHARYSSRQSADYHRGIFKSFTKHLGEDAFKGDVCEIGPGDSMGSGIYYTLNGADSVSFVERFKNTLPFEKEHEVYREIYNDIDKPSKALEEIILSFDIHEGVSVEDFFIRNEKEFDLILSASVLQHSTNPLHILELCWHRLKPGGQMMHIVDLRPLGMLEKHGGTKWLEHSPFLHRLMTRNTGRPNRVLYPEYRQWTKSLATPCDFKIRYLYGIEGDIGDLPFDEIDPDTWARSSNAIASNQERFCEAFRFCSPEALAVAGFILIVKKPDAP